MLPDELIRRAVEERPTSAWNADSMWARFSERRAREDSASFGATHAAPVSTSVSTSASTPLRPARMPVQAWIATVCAVFAVGAGLAIPYVHAPDASANRVITYRTQNAERAEFVLPDGTTVMLNVASEITIPEQFGHQNQGRAVSLTGEAYFDVTHTAGVPFSVHTPTARAIVLGTTFSVRAYDSTEARVAVGSGKVALNDLVLSAGRVGEARTDGSAQELDGYDLTALTSFTRGQLVLTQTRLAQAIPDLNRWYNADIRLDNTTIGDEYINVVLSEGSIDDLVRILNMLVPAKITRHGRTVIIS